MLSYMFKNNNNVFHFSVVILLCLNFHKSNTILMVRPSGSSTTEIYRPGTLRFVSVLSCICTVVIV